MKLLDSSRSTLHSCRAGFRAMSIAGLLALTIRYLAENKNTLPNQVDGKSDPFWDG